MVFQSSIFDNSGFDNASDDFLNSVISSVSPEDDELLKNFLADPANRDLLQQQMNEVSEYEQGLYHVSDDII